MLANLEFEFSRPKVEEYSQSRNSGTWSDLHFFRHFKSTTRTKQTFHGINCPQNGWITGYRWVGPEKGENVFFREYKTQLEVPANLFQFHSCLYNYRLTAIDILTAWFAISIWNIIKNRFKTIVMSLYRTVHATTWRTDSCFVVIQCGIYLVGNVAYLVTYTISSLASFGKTSFIFKCPTYRNYVEAKVHFRHGGDIKLVLQHTNPFLTKEFEKFEASLIPILPKRMNKPETTLNWNFSRSWASAWSWTSSAGPATSRSSRQTRSTRSLTTSRNSSPSSSRPTPRTASCGKRSASCRRMRWDGWFRPSLQIHSLNPIPSFYRIIWHRIWQSLNMTVFNPQMDPHILKTIVNVTNCLYDTFAVPQHCHIIQ